MTPQITIAYTGKFTLKMLHGICNDCSSKREILLKIKLSHGNKKGTFAKQGKNML
jgi:hypothetical protein